MPDDGNSAEALAADYCSGCEKLRSEFAASGDGIAAITARTGLVDKLATRLFTGHFCSDSSAPRLSLVAVGGYGREELFPFSDVDLLFVAPDERTLQTHRENIAALARALWDLRLRVSHSVRTLAECGQLHQGNIPFSISLLDMRYLAGDHSLFDDLRLRAIPHMVARDRQDLVRHLLGAVDQRYAKFESTIFHLEPDVKEAPGALRDYHTARWLLTMASLSEHRRWPEQWPREFQEKTAPGVRFFSAVRCLIHFERGRNDNTLSYELQERAGALGLGASYGTPVDPAAWMRQFYLHVRALAAETGALIRNARPERSGLYGAFQDWRSRLSNADFSVIRGRIFPRSPAPGELTTVLLMFEMIARHGLELSGEADAWAETSVKALTAARADEHPERAVAGLWPALRRMIALPHAADALRAMHRLGLLVVLLPEFRAVDALVIRDFYHRYTVDEHSFMAIQHLCELDLIGQSARESSGGKRSWEARLAEIASELERPDLLRFALLLHDIGKGTNSSDHIAGSLEALDGVCSRLGIAGEEAETIRFLIARHLEMSATLSRRDIFDAETVSAFARSVGSPERLRMLCLFTYADIRAVSPEALTPWKAELLWQLYAMTTNHLTRSVDRERVLSLSPESPATRALVPPDADTEEKREVERFLDGFPERYLAMHAREEIAEHFRGARELRDGRSWARVRTREHICELVVIAADRPLLFASIAGVLSGAGMDIVKAEAFSNRAGIVLDVFRFRDSFRSLELNPSEIVRLESLVTRALEGAVNPETFVQARAAVKREAHGKVKIETRIGFDDASSARSTLLELITEDRPGLLYAVSSALADAGCNIEVAVIDTEAGKAIDVFYLTAGGARLDAERREEVRKALLQALAPG